MATIQYHFCDFGEVSDQTYHGMGPVGRDKVKNVLPSLASNGSHGKLCIWLLNYEIEETEPLMVVCDGYAKTKHLCYDAGISTLNSKMERTISLVVYPIFLERESLVE